MISRDWRCHHCGISFHSYEKANPPCPECGCVKVTWIPGGGHVATVSGGFDKTLNRLADHYGMGDMNSPSPSRLNRAMPKAPQPQAVNYMSFAPGFSGPVGDGPICAPSASNFQLSGSQPIGKRFSPSGSIDAITRHTRVIGKFDG